MEYTGPQGRPGCPPRTGILYTDNAPAISTAPTTPTTTTTTTTTTVGAAAATTTARHLLNNSPDVVDDDVIKNGGSLTKSLIRVDPESLHGKIDECEL